MNVLVFITLLLTPFSLHLFSLLNTQKPGGRVQPINRWHCMRAILLLHPCLWEIIWLRLRPITPSLPLPPPSVLPPLPPPSLSLPGNKQLRSKCGDQRLLSDKVAEPTNVSDNGGTSFRFCQNLWDREEWRASAMKLDSNNTQ